MRFLTMNWPTFLTLSRVFSIPVIFLGLWLHTKAGCWYAAVTFMFACATDYMDGWLARSFGQVTRFGEFLDPIADKLLVGSTLLLLAGFGHITGHVLIPACVILCREIIISGLREWLAGVQQHVPVSALAKWKTALQLGAIVFILLGHPDTIGDPFHTIGVCLLYVAAVLTVVTGIVYVRHHYRHFSEEVPLKKSA